MVTMLQRFYSNPDVMIPWCKAVGLAPDRVPVAGFKIEHEGDRHVAVYRLLDPPPAPIDEREPERRMTVALLPFPCSIHPDAPAVGLANGRAREVAGDE